VSRVRIALAHSQRILLEGLGALLRSNAEIDLVWTGTSSEELLEALSRDPPHVALLELEMPKLNGLELARKARDSGLKSALLLLGERRGSALTTEVARAGAMGYLPTDIASDVLFEAIRAAALRLPFTPTRAAGPEWKDRVGVEALSPRELEVLRCVSGGMSSREIAAQLSLSFRTIDGYRASLMDKLFIRTVPGLVKFAIRHRVTDLEQ
jgi:DNA-binding NarL/FixJ family response regulator